MQQTVEQATRQAQRMLPNVDPTGRTFPHGFEDIGKPMPPMPPMPVFPDFFTQAMRKMHALQMQEEQEKERRRQQALTKEEIELRLDRVTEQVERLASRFGSMRYEDD